jgi:hypothetical protein
MKIRTTVCACLVATAGCADGQLLREALQKQERVYVEVDMGAFARDMQRQLDEGGYGSARFREESVVLRPREAPDGVTAAAWAFVDAALVPPKAAVMPMRPREYVARVMDQANVEHAMLMQAAEPVTYVQLAKSDLDDVFRGLEGKPRLKKEILFRSEWSEELTASYMEGAAPAKKPPGQAAAAGRTGGPDAKLTMLRERAKAVYGELDGRFSSLGIYAAAKPYLVADDADLGALREGLANLEKQLAWAKRLDAARGEMIRVNVSKTLAGSELQQELQRQVAKNTDLRVRWVRADMTQRPEPFALATGVLEPTADTGLVSKELERVIADNESLATRVRDAQLAEIERLKAGGSAP